MNNCPNDPENLDGRVGIGKEGSVGSIGVGPDKGCCWKGFRGAWPLVGSGNPETVRIHGDGWYGTTRTLGQQGSVIMLLSVSIEKVVVGHLGSQELLAVRGV